MNKIINGGYVFETREYQNKENLGNNLQRSRSIPKKSNYMKGYFKKNILNHSSFGNALSYNLAVKICNSDFDLDYFISILDEQMSNFSHICDYAIDDLVAFYERDPALPLVLSTFSFL